MSNLFYLHRSPQQCALWLNDYDARHAYNYSIGVLCNAIQFYIAEDVLHLRKFTDEYMTIHVDWCMQNIEHALWCYDYYCALQERHNKYKMVQNHDNYMEHLFIRETLKVFPYTEWRDPPFANVDSQFILLNCDVCTKWKVYYANRRKGTWHKVKPPYWLHTLRA